MFGLQLVGEQYTFTDTRGFQETRWTTANTRDAALAIFKVLTEARGTDGKELRASVIRLACFTPTEVILAYVRGLASNEVGQSTSIQVSLGDRNLTLPRAGHESKIDAIDAHGEYVVWMLSTLRDQGEDIVDVHSQPQEEYAEHCRQAEILCVAAGRPRFTALRWSRKRMPSK